MTYTYRSDPATQRLLRESQQVMEKNAELLRRLPGTTGRVAPATPSGPTLEEAQRQLEDGARRLGRSLDWSEADVQHFVWGREGPPRGRQAFGQVQLTESGPAVATAVLQEAAARGTTLQLKILDAGWGSSGYYSEAVLKRDGPKVFKRGTQMYLDHPGAHDEANRPERSVRDLAGVLETDARWDSSGLAGPGLYATAKVFANYRDMLKDMAPHIGVSIRALGKAAVGEAEGRRGPIVEELIQAQSVDYVSAAGRGGAIVSMNEAEAKLEAAFTRLLGSAEAGRIAARGRTERW
jgi:hypothetical protein